MVETAPKSVAIYKTSEPYVDLGNLLLMDNDPLPWESDKSPSEAQIVSVVRENTQYLFNKLVLLEKERVDEAILVKLPAPDFKLPREKRIPDKREPTKWEEYARAKGIVKKKKDKKVFDEPSGEWKPRYGYHRANDDTKDWLIEIPDGKDPMADYFGERIQAKKERVAKNELQRMRNVARAQKAKAEAARPPTGLTRPLEDKTSKELEVTMDRAKRATASVGKFQQKIHNEKPVKTGKKRKFLPNEISKTGTERERMLSFCCGRH